MSWSKTFYIEPKSDYALGEQIDANLAPDGTTIPFATTKQLEATKIAAKYLARDIELPNREYCIFVTCTGHHREDDPQSMPDMMNVTVGACLKPADAKFWPR